jgi:hypothetical protein
MTKTPRGIANNNPGNIDATPIEWQGEVPQHLNTDSRFEQFETAKAGIRALAKNLQGYQRRGLRTVAEMISTWAPPHENNTKAYIDYVCGAAGVTPNQVVDVTQFAIAYPMTVAIIRMENGVQPYSADLIYDALRAAGVKGVPA